MCVCGNVIPSVYGRKCSLRMGVDVDQLRHCLPSVVKSTTEAIQEVESISSVTMELNVQV